MTSLRPHSRSAVCLGSVPTFLATTRDTEELRLDMLLLNNCPSFLLCVWFDRKETEGKCWCRLLQLLLPIFSTSPVQ